MVLYLISVHLLHSLHRTQLLHQGLQAGVLLNHHGECAREESVVRVDADVAQLYVLLLRYNGGNIIDYSNIIVADNSECDWIERPLALAGPAGFHHTVAEAGVQVGSIGAVAAVYLDAAARGDKAKHLVAIDGIAAMGQLEVDTLEVLVNHGHIAREVLLVVVALLQVIALGTAHGHVVRLGHLLYGLHVAVNKQVHVERAIGNLLVKLRHLLVAHLTDDAHHRGLIVLYLAVLELALYGLAGKGCLARFYFLEALAYLGASLRGGDDVESSLVGSLRVGGEYLHLVAIVQYIA